MIRTLSKQLKEDMCVLQDNLENRWVTEDRDTARPEEARTEFSLTLKRNSKLNKPASGERHQQTVQSQERK